MSRSFGGEEMPQFVKKPVVIEAIRYDGENMHEVVSFCGTQCAIRREPQMPVLVNTLEGSLFAQVGDWIIRGIRGEFYPCKPDIFEETYEPVSEGMTA
jgi:hypothetical protein